MVYNMQTICIFFNGRSRFAEFSFFNSLFKKKPVAFETIIERDNPAPVIFLLSAIILYEVRLFYIKLYTI